MILAFRDHPPISVSVGPTSVRVAIDPGEDMGIAVFLDAELVGAGLAPRVDGEDPAARAGHAARVAVQREGREVQTLVYERPVVRRGGIVRRADVVTLALAAGGAVAALNPIDVVAREPHAWKGGVDGDAFVEIVRTRWTRPEEHARVHLPRARSLHHNVWDAVGLGVHHLRGLGLRA